MRNIILSNHICKATFVLVTVSLIWIALATIVTLNWWPASAPSWTASLFIALVPVAGLVSFIGDIATLAVHLRREGTRCRSL